MRLQLSQMGEEDYIVVLHQYIVIRSPYASTMLPSFSGARDHKKTNVQTSQHQFKQQGQMLCCKSYAKRWGGDSDLEAPGVQSAFIMEGVPLLLQ